MDIEKILIISFSCFMSSILFCIFVKYCKEKVRETREKINLKKFSKRIKRQTIIKPIFSIHFVFRIMGFLHIWIYIVKTYIYILFHIILSYN